MNVLILNSRDRKHARTPIFSGYLYKASYALRPLMLNEAISPFSFIPATDVHGVLTVSDCPPSTENTQ